MVITGSGGRCARTVFGLEVAKAAGFTVLKGRQRAKPHWNCLRNQSGIIDLLLADVVMPRMKRPGALQDHCAERQDIKTAPDGRVIFGIEKQHL